MIFKDVIRLLNVKNISKVIVNAVCIIKLSFSFHLLNKKEREMAWKEYFNGIDCIFEYHQVSLENISHVHIWKGFKSFKDAVFVLQ